VRYSDRKLLAETGSVGDLNYDVVPDELAQAVRVIVESPGSPIGDEFRRMLRMELAEHFGRSDRWQSFYWDDVDVEAFLDAVEILVETATRSIFVEDESAEGRGSEFVAIEDAQYRINRAFERFRFGYRVEDGEVRKIALPAWAKAVVGPPLLAVQQPGWEEVDRSFREALEHQRARETDDALAAANDAIVAALKAAKMRGSTLDERAASFRASTLGRHGLVPGYLFEVPELIEDLLESLQAARSTEVAARGEAPRAAEVPAALADFAIHVAGAFVAYLADPANDDK
jgi:hypothetical protein